MMRTSALFFLVLLYFASALVTPLKKQVKTAKKTHKSSSEVDGVKGFEGCPYDNVFYYNGVITSPYYPNNYPNNDHCYYWLYASLGNVLRFNFTHFDLETCCDYVVIYDGYGEASPILAQFGGTNATAAKPSGLLYSSNRYALMEFITDPVVTKTGFRMEYDSVATVTPCNRDIILIINGLSSVGTQANFVKQLQFIANNLIAGWDVSTTNKVRVAINLQVDQDYAVVFDTDQFPDTKSLQSTILGLTDYVPDVTQNNGSDFESLFRYGADDIQLTFSLRQGISTVMLIFVAQNPNNDQDYYEATEFAHDMRDQSDVKVITIAMGTGIDVTKVGRLSYGQGFYFGADYSQLATLAAPVNKAICQTEAAICGP